MQAFTQYGRMPYDCRVAIVGNGMTSDGYDMVAPSGEGAIRCMRMALKDVHDPVDYKSIEVGAHYLDGRLQPVSLYT